MALVVDVPDVRYVVLLEVDVHALGDVDEPVLVAAGQVEKLQLGLRCGRIRNSSAGGFVFGAEENAPIHANVSRWLSRS